MMKGGALEGGMPLWKHNVNILLTALENVVFGTYLTEYHSGFRAYSSKVLESIKFDLNSDGFVFDTEIIAQILLHNFKIEEVPIRTRYFDEASLIKLWPGILYGVGILKTLLKYTLHTHTFVKFKQFELKPLSDTASREMIKYLTQNISIGDYEMLESRILRKYLGRAHLFLGR